MASFSKSKLRQRPGLEGPHLVRDVEVIYTTQKQDPRDPRTGKPAVDPESLAPLPPVDVTTIKLKISGVNIATGDKATGFIKMCEENRRVVNHETGEIDEVTEFNVEENDNGVKTIITSPEPPDERSAVGFFLAALDRNENGLDFDLLGGDDIISDEDGSFRVDWAGLIDQALDFHSYKQGDIGTPPKPWYWMGLGPLGVMDEDAVAAFTATVRGQKGGGSAESGKTPAKAAPARPAAKAATPAKAAPAPAPAARAKAAKVVEPEPADEPEDDGDPSTDPDARKALHSAILRVVLGEEKGSVPFSKLPSRLAPILQAMQLDLDDQTTLQNMAADTDVVDSISTELNNPDKPGWERKGNTVSAINNAPSKLSAPASASAAPAKKKFGK